MGFVTFALGRGRHSEPRIAPSDDCLHTDSEEEADHRQDHQRHNGLIVVKVLGKSHDVDAQALAGPNEEFGDHHCSKRSTDSATSRYRAGIDFAPSQAATAMGGTAANTTSAKVADVLKPSHSVMIGRTAIIGVA